jgi:hypothetical protein
MAPIIAPCVADLPIPCHHVIPFITIEITLETIATATAITIAATNPNSPLGSV